MQTEEEARQTLTWSRDQDSHPVLAPLKRCQVANMKGLLSVTLALPYLPHATPCHWRAVDSSNGCHDDVCLVAAKAQSACLSSGRGKHTAQ